MNKNTLELFNELREVTLITRRMMRVYIIIWIILSMGFRAAAQDKLLVAGSGNPNILLLDKQTGKVEWDKVTTNVFLSAMGQAFFSLSLAHNNTFKYRCIDFIIDVFLIARFKNQISLF